jgi:C1A family cysteine protease
VAATSPSVDGLKNALASYGPLVTTMNVYNDFYSYSGRIYSYVGGQGNTYQGAHAVTIIGYDDLNQCFIVIIPIPAAPVH